LELGRELLEIDKRVGGHCWYEEKKERRKVWGRKAAARMKMTFGLYIKLFKLRYFSIVSKSSGSVVRTHVLSAQKRPRSVF
jgi:hypothetical protein